jgi:hypothetical protein
MSENRFREGNKLVSKLSERILGNAKRWSVPGVVLLMAAAILFMITVNWNSWAGERVEQETW